MSCPRIDARISNWRDGHPAPSTGMFLRAQDTRARWELIRKGEAIVKLSRASGYAVRALVVMAAEAGKGGGGQLVASHQTAQVAGVPEKFLLKVFKPLVAAGILQSKKGIGGGYSLARPASKITLLEVIEAVDGPLRGDALILSRWINAALDLDTRVQDICQRVADQTRQVLARVRISDLVRASAGGS